MWLKESMCDNSFLKKRKQKNIMLKYTEEKFFYMKGKLE